MTTIHVTVNPPQTVVVSGSLGDSVQVGADAAEEINVSATTIQYSATLQTSGLQGPQGATGATGPANTLTIGTVVGGDTADATITGDAPDQVLSLVLPKGQDAVIVADDLPPEAPSLGKLWFRADDGSLYFWYEDIDSAQWIAVSGPMGPQGETGDTGETGPQGEQGPKGDKGDTGAGLVISGELDDPSELPAEGFPGEGYLIDGDLWVWTGSEWEDVGQIQGPEGPPGPKGDTGDTGPAGANGTNGTNGTTEISFSIPGTLTVGSGEMRWYFTQTVTVTNVVATVGTAPTGASLIFDVNKNGTTIFTTQANRPTITATNFTDLSSTPDVTSFSSGDYITVDVDQIGSTIAGADAVVRIVLG